MELDTRLQNVAVIGACGKMGRGIALLLLQEMTVLSLAHNSTQYHLKLIDPNESAYLELKSYLRQQILRYAEKNINKIRTLFAKDSEKVSNGEMIQAFIDRALGITDCSISVASVKRAKLVFEAAFEDIALKSTLLADVHKIVPEAYVFTNTSSIPIGLLAEKSGLGSALIGYHFYNPPAVQKLLEIIPSKVTSKELEKLAVELGKRLGKIMVYSKDVAGFIGNGHFAAEIVYACSLAVSLSSQYTLEGAIELIDRVTRDLLLRPMGVFQLLDYVGLPIIKQILIVMDLQAPLIDKWIQDGLVGGHSKDGIFHYINGDPVSIWSLKIKQYIPLNNEPPVGLSWKKIQKDPSLLNDLPKYFETLDSELALQFLRKSKDITDELVSKRIAASHHDVATVLKNGFFHLYSPDEVLK